MLFRSEYDQTGEWEYLCIVKTEKDETQFVTVVNCGVLVANSTIDTGVIGTMLYFGENGLLTVDTGTEAHSFQEHVDCYIIDERTSHLYLSDEYDSVEVT